MHGRNVAEQQANGAARAGNSGTEACLSKQDPKGYGKTKTTDVDKIRLETREMLFIFCFWFFVSLENYLLILRLYYLCIFISIIQSALDFYEEKDEDDYFVIPLQFRAF